MRNAKKLSTSLSRKAGLIHRLAFRHGVSRVRVFGSFARGDQRRGSDLDLLVRMRKGSDLLDLIGFKHDLEDALGRKVDVLTDGAISPYIREKILREARPL